MFRINGTSFLIVLAVSAGCRSLPARSPVNQDAEAPISNRAPLAAIEQTASSVHVAAFSQPANRIEDTADRSAGAESLPTPSSESPQDAPVTLADLEGIALASNPTLAAARARIDAARGRQLQAGLYPNPVAGYQGTEIGNQGTAGQQGAFVSQRVITGGKLRLDEAIAGREIQDARFGLQAQEQRVLSDVRLRFYDGMVAQRRVELTNELARIGDELVTATQKLLEGRLGTENDLLQAQIRADESYILRDNARNEHVEAWRRLAAVVGIPAMQIRPLAGEPDPDPPNFDWGRCYAMVLGRNPELNAARTRVQRASIVVARARREPIPNVDVLVSVRHHNVSGSDVANVQLGLPLPLFDKNQGNIRSAEAEWIASRQDLERIRLDLLDRLAVAYRRYENARQQVERYGQRIVPQAERSLKLVLDGYEQGQVAYLTLLIAQQTYYQVNLSYLDSLRELWASSAVIEGQLLTGSLAGRG